MNKQNTQSEVSTPGYVKAAEFSWRAPFYALLVIIVGNIVGMTFMSEDVSMQHIDFLMITLWYGAAIIGAGFVCSLFGMVASASHRRFSPLFSAIGGLVLNGAVVYGLVVMFGDAFGI